MTLPDGAELLGALEHATEGVARLDVDGRYTFVSGVYAATLGYEPAELVGLAWRVTVHPADRERLAACYRAMVETGVAEVEARGVRKDGGTFYKRVVLAVVRGPGGELLGHYCFCKDVTAQREANEAQRLAEAERARLRESEATARAQAEHFRLLAETMPQIVWAATPDGDNDFLNRRWHEYSGLPFERSRGAGWVEAVHPDDRARVGAAWVEALGTGTTYECLMRVRRLDGAYHWHLARALPVRDEAGAIVRWVGTATDVDAQRRVEEERRAIDEHLRQVAEAIPQHVWTSNAAGECEFTNARWREYAGRTAGQMLGRGWLEVLHPDDVPQVEGVWRASVGRGEAFELECRLRRADGQYRWFLARGLPLRDAEGTVVRWFGTNTDIDGHKRAAEAARETQEWLEAMVRARTAELDEVNHALRREIERRRSSDEARARLAAIVESSSDAMFRADVRGRIESWNAGAERLYGLGAASAIGRPVRELVHPSCREVAEALCEGLLAGGAHEPHEIVHVGAGGRAVPVAVSVAPIRDPAGALVGLSFVVRDVSSVKEAEHRLRESLREKELLLMEVHHRVKNNLQVICSLLSLQGSKLSDPGALEMFRESENRVRSIALAHEKLYQSKDLARVDLAAHVRDVVSNLLNTYGGGAGAAEFCYELDEVWLGVDEAIPCGLIVNELASNALKHAFRGRAPGRVRVSLRHRPGGPCVLRVEDDGVGLPEGFEPERTRSLGLKLVSTLTRQVRGTLRASSPGGASFEIRFVPAPGTGREAPGGAS
jgi:PAS domain S-box-containing protein